MKRVLSLFLLLLIVPLTASALSLSHRYIIPKTNYTIEFPWFFVCGSTIMNEVEPTIYEHDVNYDELLAVMNESEYEMMAYSTAAVDVFISISVNEYASDVGFTSQDLSETELENLGDTLAKEYYDSHPTETPINEEDISSIYHGDYVRFVTIGCTNDSGYSEHHIIIENNYMIDIVADFSSTEYESFMQAVAVVQDILDSIKDDYMVYGQYTP